MFINIFIIRSFLHVCHCGYIHHSAPNSDIICWNSCLLLLIMFRIFIHKLQSISNVILFDMGLNYIRLKCCLQNFHRKSIKIPLWPFNCTSLRFSYIFSVVFSIQHLLHIFYVILSVGLFFICYQNSYRSYSQYFMLAYLQVVESLYGFKYFYKIIGIKSFLFNLIINVFIIMRAMHFLHDDNVHPSEYTSHALCYHSWLFIPLVLWWFKNL